MVEHEIQMEFGAARIDSWTKRGLAESGDQKSYPDIRADPCFRQEQRPSRDYAAESSVASEGMGREGCLLLKERLESALVEIYIEKPGFEVPLPLSVFRFPGIPVI